MNEDNVSMVGEQFGRAVHRSIKVSRCENGYIVAYKVLSEDAQNTYDRTAERTKVFITNSDMLEFVEKYFAGEPKP